VNPTAITDLYAYNNLCLINGKWVSAEDQRTIPVTNPFNNAWLAEIPCLTSHQIDEAIEAAQKAYAGWKATPPSARREVLHGWKSIILDNIEDISKILVHEQGKPYAEAVGELQYSLSYIDYYADEAIRTYGEIIPSPFLNAEISVVKEPIGVVGIIAPWNFPTTMFVRKIAPCLAAGCTCVLKPDERTPLSAFALLKLAVEAGFPAGVINCVTGDAEAIGAALCASRVVKKISFTGSIAVGKQLMRESSHTVKKLTLELGGNAPFLVFEDANIDNSVNGLMAAKFRNAGQTCVAANRIYIHSAVYRQFIEVLLERMAKLKMGNGMDPDVSIGPIIDSRAMARLESYVQRSIAQGAKVIYGGAKWEENSNFYKPTVIVDVSDDMPVMSCEVFGPIVSISKFNSDDAVLVRANNTMYGLACYLYTENIKRISRFKQELQYGMIGVNTGVISSAVIPFGGIKESGFGREGARQGIDEYLVLKYICLQN
jgi:succinate-semialdehyde dehydrogenase/glutarate-semialdehyde dehydrogenase